MDKEKMKIAVFGIGGVGGILGGALARSHPETYFLVRGENLKAIRRDGLRVQSPSLGDFTARPRLASDSAADLGPMDAVILACKGYHLKDACEAIVPMVGPETLVVPLLNGVLVSEGMEPLLLPCVLADGLIWIFSHLEEPGHVIQTSGLCRVIMGMRDGSRPAKLAALVDILNGAGVRTKLSENILVDSWEKYVRVCSLGVLFCCYDGPAGKVREDPNYRAVLGDVIGEMTAVAAARGVTLPQELSGQLVTAFEKMEPDTITSLYRDLKSGKPAEQTELHQIIGRMVEMGREAGIATPYHERACKKFA